MIRDLRDLAPQEEWDARIKITLRRMGRMDEYDLTRWIAMCPPTHPVRLAAEGEIRRRAALEAENEPLRGRDLRLARIQRVLDACPRDAMEAVPTLGDAIAVIANLVGEDIAVTLAHLLRNHASTSEAIWALGIVERVRAQAS